MRLAFPEENVESVLEALARRLSPRIVRGARAAGCPCRRELDEYFAGRRRAFELTLDWSLIGAVRAAGAARDRRDPLRRRVSATRRSPAEAGSPRGSRAAGNALGANPIPIVIPCHRVLRTGGALGGYGGGLDRKRWLLELEGALTPAGSEPGVESSAQGVKGRASVLDCQAARSALAS